MYPFPVTQITDLSDIPELYLAQVTASLLSNRSNDLSHQPTGSQAVFVYNKDGETEVRLFDRIKDMESYLRGAADNYNESYRKTEQVYVLERN